MCHAEHGGISRTHVRSLFWGKWEFSEFCVIGYAPAGPATIPLISEEEYISNFQLFIKLSFEKKQRIEKLSETSSESVSSISCRHSESPDIYQKKIRNHYRTSRQKRGMLSEVTGYISERKRCSIWPSKHLYFANKYQKSIG